MRYNVRTHYFTHAQAPTSLFTCTSVHCVATYLVNGLEIFATTEYLSRSPQVSSAEGVCLIAI